MGLSPSEVALISIVGLLRIAWTLVPLVAVVVLWKRVRRVEARLSTLDRERGGVATS